MKMRIIPVVFVLSALGHADEDVVERAARSAWIPTFSIHYSHRSEAPHVLWAGFTWSFDELLLGGRVAMAIQIKRLERETIYLEHAARFLEQEAPSFD